MLPGCWCAFRRELGGGDEEGVQVGDAGRVGSTGSRSDGSPGVQQPDLAQGLHAAAAHRPAGAAAVSEDRPPGCDDHGYRVE